MPGPSDLQRSRDGSAIRCRPPTQLDADGGDGSGWFRLVLFVRKEAQPVHPRPLPRLAGYAITSGLARGMDAQPAHRAFLLDLDSVVADHSC